MNTQLRDPEEEIKAAIAEIPGAKPGNSNREWTVAIKRSLIALGKKKEYKICAGGFPEECEREWLFDLVWYRTDTSEHLLEIGVIVESEWSFNPAHLRFDFEKLLIAKSPIKVMIFQDCKNNVDQLCSFLEASIRAFKTNPANEKYIFACYHNEKDAFEFKTIIA